MKISLATLTELHSLSVRTYNVCFDNELTDLDEILNFYVENKTFRNLNKAGKKTEQELITVCKYYTTNFFSNQSFDSICFTQNINKEALLYIKNNNVNSLEEFIKSYSPLKNIPVDLKKIFYKYHFLKKIEPIPEVEKNGLVKKIENFSSSEIIALIEFKRKKERKNLSTRSYNILDQIIFEVKSNPFAILKYENDDSILSLETAGEKSLKQLSPFIKEILSNLKNITVGQDNKNEFKIIQLQNKLNYATDTFKKWLEDRDLHLDSILPPLQLIEFHLCQKITKMELDILREFFFHQNEYGRGTLKTLGKKYSITTERVRQIKNKSITKIENEVSLLKEMLEEFDIKLKDYLDGKFFLMSLQEIVKIDKVNLPHNIIYKTLSIIYDKYDLVINDNKKHNYEYLAPSEIIKSIDIQKLISDIQSKVDSRINKTIRLHFGEFLAEYKRDNQFESNYDGIRILVIKILNERFNIRISNEQILIPRNTQKLTYEYIEEILERNSKPMNVAQIQPLLNFYFKEKPKSVESVRSQMRQHPDVFILTDWSTYGLKKWEEEGSLLGGTHKQLIEKFLKKFDEPKHIYEISKFVLQYRDTSIRSLFGNIKLDPQNIFTVFEGGFIGLSSKKYPKSKTVFNKVNNKWFNTFKNHFIINGRSQTKLKELCENLSMRLNVKPIQIEYLVSERIEKGELFIDKKGFLFLNDTTEDNHISETHNHLLDIESLERIKKKLINENHLDALKLCMTIAKNKGNKISISEAKFILDELYIELRAQDEEE